MTEKIDNTEILVVDDSAENLKIMHSMLSAGGYKVRAASSADVAFRSIQISKPALILLDIQMPEIDGLEMCRRLKKDQETADIPIVFVSGSGEDASPEAAQAAGAQGFLIKPFRMDNLLEITKQFLD